jgi:hypothetical protein
MHFSNGLNILINPRPKVMSRCLPMVNVVFNECLPLLGHAVVEMSTKDFFTWLQQAETEVEDGEEEGN